MKELYMYNKKYKRNGTMKNKSTPIKIGDALEILKQQWPECPSSFIRQGIKLHKLSRGKKGIPVAQKSGIGSRCHLYVFIEDVFRYQEDVRKLAA